MPQLNLHPDGVGHGSGPGQGATKLSREATGQIGIGLKRLGTGAQRHRCGSNLAARRGDHRNKQSVYGAAHRRRWGEEASFTMIAYRPQGVSKRLRT